MSRVKLPREPLAAIALAGCKIDRTFGGLVEITEASRANRRFPDRVTETLGVCLKLGPAHHVAVNGRDVVYPADAICVRGPGCIWSTPSTGLVGFLSIDLDPSLLPSGLSRGTMLFEAPKTVPNLHQLVQRFRTSVSPDQLAEDIISLVLALARARLISAGELQEQAPGGVSTRVRGALEGALARPPSLADLAADNRVSRFALLRQFKRDFGVTPHAFVLRLRVERARERLARGDDLAATAFALGFADQPHFTRVFRRIVGLAPGDYARRVRRVVPVG